MALRTWQDGFVFSGAWGPVHAEVLQNFSPPKGRGCGSVLGSVWLMVDQKLAFLGAPGPAVRGSWGSARSLLVPQTIATLCTILQSTPVHRAGFGFGVPGEGLVCFGQRLAAGGPGLRLEMGPYN